MSWKMGDPNAIDARRDRAAHWVARGDSREDRRTRLRGLPVHDREPVRRRVEALFAQRRDRQGASRDRQGAT